jgi:hypothetical protein
VGFVVDKLAGEQVFSEYFVLALQTAALSLIIPSPTLYCLDNDSVVK